MPQLKVDSEDIPLPKDSIFADLITAMETKKPLNINAKISSKIIINKIVN